MNNLPAEKNRRILIIDDNRAIHDDFRKILSPATSAAAALEASETALFGKPVNAVRKIQYQIDSAYQGQEAVLMVKKALAEGRPYALAFVDIRMPPGWDGVETTQKIWALDPEIQIVLCTAYADYSWDEMFEKIGNSDGLVILKKPFDTVEALQLAHAFTEKWWLHQQSRKKMDELEMMVAERTTELQWKTAFLEAQVSSSMDGILIVDGQRQKLLQNRRMDGLFKIPRAIAEDKNDDAQLHWVAGVTSDPESFLANVLHLNAHPDETSREELSLKDGTFLERYSGPVTGADGKYYGRLWTFRDITARKLAENILRESEERFSSAFGFAPIGMALVALDGRWLKVNRAICELVGYSEAELLARTFQEITHPDDLAADLENVRRLLAGEIRFYEMEKRYIHARGHFVTILLNVSAVRDGRNEPLYFIAQIQDITERKRAAMALLESQRFLRSTLDALTSHIAILDEHGKIIEVNAAWNHFAGENHFEASNGVGENYLKVCDAAAANFSKEAPMMADGIRAVIAGKREEFKLEYPCPGPREKRWFLVRVTRFSGDGPVRVVVAHENITGRKRAEARFRLLVDSNAQGVFFWNTTGEITGANDAFLDFVGYSREDLESGRMSWTALTPPEYAELDRRGLHEVSTKGNSTPYEKEFIRKDGVRVPVLIGTAVFQDSPENGVAFTIDIGGRKKLEAQLFQSQKLETVGKLAGGIAHEFNSILTAIIGQSELLLNDLPVGSPLIQNATEISRAANRAATLTRQLLAYGRKQFLQPESLDLNRVVAGMAGVFQHLMGDGVETYIVPAASLHAVKADAGQIEQVIMNLAINARDAMPNGGKLTLETANISFDPDSVGRYPELKPGDYVMLAITDTGTGMSDAVKARVFEPFFTTKGVGQGTGLGLSTCYGIIKQSGGHISVYSELGRGTTFKIYLPQVEVPGQIPVARLASPDLPGGTETVLLVEDDPALREMAATLLRRLGYTVFAAANGVEALSVQHERRTGHVDLLFTDVVMPHMSGKELADRVRALYPDTKILFTSAYTENAIVQQGVLDKGVALLQKPFTPSALAHKLRAALDQPVAARPDGAQETFGFTKNSGGGKIS